MEIYSSAFDASKSVKFYGRYWLQCCVLFSSPLLFLLLWASSLHLISSLILHFKVEERRVWKYSFFKEESTWSQNKIHRRLMVRSDISVLSLASQCFLSLGTISILTALSVRGASPLSLRWISNDVNYFTETGSSIALQNPGGVETLGVGHS